jgi:hypothetical protein
MLDIIKKIFVFSPRVKERKKIFILKQKSNEELHELVLRAEKMTKSNRRDLIFTIGSFIGCGGRTVLSTKVYFHNDQSELFYKMVKKTRYNYGSSPNWKKGKNEGYNHLFTITHSFDHVFEKTKKLLKKFRIEYEVIYL